jgi:peptidyl-tRNA hydrolase, PTH1 family
VWIIVGLGNPGAEYDQTRHNIGFVVLDQLAKRWGLTFKSEKKYHGLYTAGTVGSEKVHLLKPTTYMNLSGQAVRPLMDWFRLTPEQVLVIYDEVALPVGKLRLRKEGSAAGHNGIKSLIEHLGTQNFCRLRLGVDPPPSGHELKNYVLGRFTPEQQKILPLVLDAAIAATEMTVSQGIDQAMNTYNGWQA